MTDKILCLIRANAKKSGGAEIYLNRLSDALSEKKIVHERVSSPFPRWLPSWLRALLFNLYVMCVKKDRYYFSLERISCPDIYRAGDGVHRVYTSAEKKALLNPLHFVYFYLERRCFSRAKKIIANSAMVKAQIIKTYGINPKKIEVVYNGVPEVVYDHEQSRRRLSREFDLKPQEKIFLLVGSGFQRKGVGEFLEILSKIQHTAFKAFVVGSDKHLARYQQQAKTKILSDRVIFTGMREDVSDFYAISDIFLLPTHYDPFSNVVLEAMAFENAVITTQQNGACELLAANVVMKNPRDFGIVSVINTLLDDSEALHQMKARNREIADNYTMRRNVEHTLKVIDETIN